MTAVVRGIGWLGIFIGICVAPLVFALMSTDRPGLGFWTDFSVALGFVGLSLMGVEFALVARVKPVAEPFGTDALIDFHRQIGYAGLAFVLIHVALSADLGKARAFTPSETPARVLFGAVAAGALAVLVATSVWRRQFRLSYEIWQILHAVLAVVAVVVALVHVLLVNYYVDTVWKQVLWAIMAAAFLGLLAWVRLLRPLQIRRRPWTVERITPERDRTTVLTLRPAGHDGLLFEPVSSPGSRWADRRSRSPPIRSRSARAPRPTAASRSPSRPPVTSVPASRPSRREPRSMWTARTGSSRSTSTKAPASA